MKDRIIRKLEVLIIPVFFLLIVEAKGANINFDKGVNFEEFIEGIKYSARMDENRYLSVENALMASEDCGFVSFNYGDPLISPETLLESHVYRKVCQNYQGHNYCHDELVRIVKRNVKVTLSGPRKMLPWERDIFRVCLKDTKLSYREVEVSHKYKFTEKYGPEDFYTLNAYALKKLKTDPDSTGIYISFWGVSPENTLTLELKDKWSEIYGAGNEEKTIIKVVLKMEKDLWFDPVILEKEISFAPAESYKIDFSKYKNEFKHEMQPGRKYFVEWGFVRKGKISRDTFVPCGQTGRIFLSLP